MIKKIREKMSAVRYIKIILLVAILGVSALGASMYWVRQNIGTLFNEVAARQMVVKGTLTVEDITADWDGCVFFKNLVWIDNRGRTAATIPNGSFKIRLWDIITRNIKPESIRLIDLRDAKLAITFNERMAIQSIDRRKQVPKKDAQGKPITNIPIERYNLDARLVLIDCTLEAFFENRHFLMYDVSSELNINTKNAISGYFKSGFFGGTISADGLEISGDIDLTKPIHEYNLDLVLKEVNPSTLGAGIGVYEPVSAWAKMTGPLPKPTIKGSLSMKDLVLPGLHFNDVKGKFVYDGGKISASEITAKAFDGDVVASGYFNIDDKTYMVDMVGKYLKGQLAAGKDLICLVSLTAKMQGFGDPKSVLTTGSFKSSEGMYKGVFFKSISADVRNQYGLLEFNNVLIRTPLLSLSTSLTLERGKVHIGKIETYKSARKRF
mgnify:CR=1 FL=1